MTAKPTVARLRLQQLQPERQLVKRQLARKFPEWKGEESAALLPEEKTAEEPVQLPEEKAAEELEAVPMEGMARSQNPAEHRTVAAGAGRR